MNIKIALQQSNFEDPISVLCRSRKSLKSHTKAVVWKTTVAAAGTFKKHASFYCVLHASSSREVS